MSGTEKLYNADAYAVEFDATVLSCERKARGEERRGGTTCEEAFSEALYDIVLDRTLFFPEEGGQSPDKGLLNGRPVLDVQIAQDVIVHTLAAPIAVGEKAHGSIDWKHRFSNMQQHSGEHIFSGLVCRRFGYRNVGFHLSDQIVTMDFSGALSKQEAAEIEWQANEVIAKNLPVHVLYPSREELESMDYRSKTAVEGQVRVVEIPGVDLCACCAPHVRATGEIGMLKIMSMQSYKGGVRLSILCGFRALLDFRQRIGIISELSALLSASPESLPTVAERLKEANQQLKYELTAQKLRCIREKAEGIPAKEEDVCLFEDGLEAQEMRMAVNGLTEKHSGICAVFSGGKEQSFQFIIGSARDDVRTIMSLLRERFGARGGGSAAMVQGSVKAEKEELRNLFSHFYCK